MAILVDVPGMGEVEFPDGMSNADIEAAIKRSMQPAAPMPVPASLARDPSAQPTIPATPGDAPMTEGQKWAEAGKNVASAVARPIAQGVAALPLMVMDAGVAARNLIQGAYERNRAPTLSELVTGKRPFQPYELPSAMFQQSLDSVTRPPDSPVGRGAEMVSSMIAGARMPMPTPTVANAAPAGFRGAQQGMREEVLRQANAAGYVVPPSSVNPSFGNRLLEGLAGKVKLNQEAGLRNMDVTNTLMARSVGENSGAPVTSGALNAIRSETVKQAYEPIRSIGTVTTDAKYLSELDALTKAAKGADRSFPGLAKPSPLDDTVAVLKSGSFDAGDGVDAIAYLRGLADDAYSAGQRSLGKAYKGAATAIENMIERDLQGRGKDGSAILSAYREGRKLIAKTYTANKAMVGQGEFNARAVASELAKGAPLEGPQRLVGNFATTFNKYALKPTGENFPSVSPLDAYGSAIAAGSLDSVAPFAYPLTRAGLRSYLLSPAGQARAFPQQQQQVGFGLAGAFPFAAQAGGGLFQ